MNVYGAGDYNSAMKACEQWPIRTPIVEAYITAVNVVVGGLNTT